jgi:hypothetical protein
MVLQGEGRGNISSPHSVNILGTKILPKWRGMIQIGSLYCFSSISILSEWKKLEESTCRAILVACPSLENWGLKHSWAILRNQMTFFLVKTFLAKLGPRDVILHIDTFPTMQIVCQSELVCKIYASRKLTYCVDHHGTRGCHIRPPLLMHMGLAMCVVSRIF